MIAPVRTLLKRELEWLGTNRCRHSHTYLEHYKCFLEEKPSTAPFRERIGFFDIETSNLKADYGILYSYGILCNDTGKTYGRAITRNELITKAPVPKGEIRYCPVTGEQIYEDYIFDRRLMAECIRDLKRFQRIVVHWGLDRRHDLPYIRTRALMHGLEFPLYKDIYGEDTWPMAKNKLALASNRLEAICRAFGIAGKEHKLIPAIWVRAGVGDPPALNHIWLHNEEDVHSLRDVWRLLHGFVPRGKRSI